MNDNSSSSGFPSMTALLGLLAIAGYQNRDKIAEILRDLTGGGADDKAPQGQVANQTSGQPAGQSQQGQIGGLRDVLAGTSVGGLLTGGLGELMDRLNQAGQKDAADSWVSKGANKDIAPNDLSAAIGPEVLQTLTRITGLSQDELLKRLSKELPTAIDKYTPDGRVSAA